MGRGALAGQEELQGRRYGVGGAMSQSGIGQPQHPALHVPVRGDDFAAPHHQRFNFGPFPEEGNDLGPFFATAQPSWRQAGLVGIGVEAFQIFRANFALRYHGYPPTETESQLGCYNHHPRVVSESLS